jgi:hypothetical protein
LKPNEKFLHKPISDFRILRKIKWEVDSPRFQAAMISLGYTKNDVTLRDIKYFQKEDYSDKKIVKMRYHHHLLKL